MADQVQPMTAAQRAQLIVDADKALASGDVMGSITRKTMSLPLADGNGAPYPYPSTEPTPPVATPSVPTQAEVLDVIGRYLAQTKE